MSLPDHLQTVLGAAYRIERELPGGGMSRLFLATETALKRPVVIKLLPSELTSETSAARFQREIELAAQLQHPHILPVHAAGSRDGLLYYVMPYIPGESLRGRLTRERRLPVADALRILMEVADALAYAHRSGVVHRDIKPENILLAQGHALLADFGIARALGEGTVANRVTGTGVAVGTPGYMAPEQAAGDRQVDARADVYALAVVGYEMLAGAPPFSGTSAREILAAHLTAAPPSLSERNPETPRAVCDAIHRALAKSPDDRFRTAAEMRDALQSGLASHERAATVVGTGAPAGPRPATRGARAPGRESLLAGARTLLRRIRRQAVPVVQDTRSVSRCTVAVLPFSIRGSDKLAYLGEGLVDLLSTKLDGLADLCTADPRAVLSLVLQEGRRTFDPQSASSIARRLGAGRFILGSLIEAGGRLQLNATLYDVDGTVRSSAQASANDEASLFDLVDELCIKLLAGQTQGESPNVTRLEAATTNRLDALKAYLEGERLFRSGAFTAAKEAFQRAVRVDESFALAWYRLSVAAEWTSDRVVQDAAAERALEHAGRLSEHDRLLLEAFIAWRRGSPAAEGLYRNVVATYPNDVEAWFQLGEVLFHYGPLCGRSIAASREAWERILSFEPEHLLALYHLARIASVETHTAELDALTERVLALASSSERALESRALRAFALGDEVEQQQVIAAMRGASDTTLIVAIRTVAVYTGNLDGAAALARLLAEPSRTPEMRALAHLKLAYLEVARGRWPAAKAELATVASYDEAMALPARGLLSALPFLALPGAELEEARAAIAAWDAAAVPRATSANMYVRIHDGLHAHLKAYVLGVLSARLGDYAAAHRHATELAGIGGTAVQCALGRALSDGVHAHIAAQRGESAAALATLERATLETSYDLPLASPFFSRSAERYLRATLLATHGNHEDAVRWLEAIAQVSVYDVVYLAPSHARRAELSARAGDRARADLHSRRAAELWPREDASRTTPPAPSAENAERVMR